jgi:glycine betaine/proline transport system substrate-binding protein
MPVPADERRKDSNVRRGKVLPRLAAVVAIALTLSVTAAACGKRSTGTSGEAAKTVTIGVLQGWAEDEAATELWRQVLKKKGYTVNIKHLNDAGPMFTGLADGDLDLFLDTWLPKTHKTYVDRYHSKIEDLGIWYDTASLTITVPKYVNIDSIADLKGHAGEFGGKIVGIEPGAGLTAAAKDAIKGYGLSSEYTLQTSSSAGMLASLKAAEQKHQPIVVTLWHPHWAYSKYALKDLSDPKGLMGAAEKIHSYGTKGFGSAHAQLAKWLGNFTMTDAQLASLENLVQTKGAQAGVSAWIAQNPDFVKQMTS